MKYRIVELNSGKFQLQYKDRLGSDWISFESYFDNHHDAKQGYYSLIKNEIKNIVEIIK